MIKVTFKKVKFAKAVHNRRWGRGMILQDVSKKTGISVPMLSRIEKANCNIRLDVYMTLCLALDLDPMLYVEWTGKEQFEVAAR